MKFRRLLLWLSLLSLLLPCGMYVTKKIRFHGESAKLFKEYADSIEISAKHDRNIRIWNADVPCEHGKFRVEGRSHGIGIRAINSLGDSARVYNYMDYVYVSRVTVSEKRCILFVEIEGKKSGHKDVHDLIVFDLIKMRIKGTLRL